MADKSEIIKEHLSQVIDPDMDVDIINLGLIYKIELDNDICNIEMTMPTRSCQFGESMTQNVIRTVENIDFISKCNLNMVWDPVWTKERMSKLARMTLGV